MSRRGRSRSGCETELRVERAAGDCSTIETHRRPALQSAGEDGRLEFVEIVALIGHRLVAADELLDLGLVLDFDDGTRLTVPLDGTDAEAPEVAEFGGEPGGLWPWGEPPFVPADQRG